MAKNLIPKIFFDSELTTSETPWEHSSDSFGSQRKKYKTSSDVISVSTANTYNDLQFSSLLPDETSFYINDSSTDKVLDVKTETFQGSNFFSDSIMPFFISAGGNTNLNEYLEPDLKWGFFSTTFEGRYAYPESEYICLDEIQFQIMDTINYDPPLGTVTITTVPFWS